MRDPELAAFVDAMIVRDIIPMLPPVHGLDIQDYRAAVLQRFRDLLGRAERRAEAGAGEAPTPPAPPLIQDPELRATIARIEARFDQGAE